MRCGKGHDHETVAEVRACYGVGESSATVTLNYRPNRYAGNCARCGAKVGPEEGRIDRREDGSGWDVSHIAGGCPSSWVSGADSLSLRLPRRFRAVRTSRPFAEVTTRRRVLQVTIDLDFWYVTEGRKPGYRFVKRYIGGTGPVRITGAVSVRALKAILEAGVEKSGELFAEKFERLLEV